MVFHIRITTTTEETKYLDGFKADLEAHGFACNWSRYRKGKYIPCHPDLQERGANIELSRSCRTPSGRFHWIQFVLALANLTLDNPKVEILD